MTTPLRSLFALTGSLLFTTPLAAQTIVPLVTDSQTLAGIGKAEVFRTAHINDQGDWLVLIETDHDDEEQDEIVLRNGFLTMREGSFVSQPPGFRVTLFNSMSVDSFGDITWDLELSHPTQGGTAGTYWNTRMVTQQFEPLQTPGYGRTARWFKFNGFVKHNRQNQMLVLSEVDDQSISGVADEALILLQLDDDRQVVSSVDVAHERGTVPMQGFNVVQDGLSLESRHFYDLNEQGDVMWQARIDDGSENLRALFLNATPVAVDDRPSGVGTFDWLSVANARLDLNDAGDYVHEGSINASSANTRDVILKNGTELVMRERQTFADVSPLLVNGFGSNVPILLSDRGDVFYRVNLTGNAAFDAALVVNQEVIVRKGESFVGTEPLVELVDGQDSLAVSPSGRYVLFRADKEDGSTGLFQVDLGNVRVLPDCGSNPATLSRFRGFPIVGGRVTLGVDGGQGIGVTPFLLVSYGTQPSYDETCGVPVPGVGELVIDLDAPNPFLISIGTPWGGTPVPIDLDVVNDVSLIGTRVYAQSFFLDIGDQYPGSQLIGSNAVEIEIGAP